MSTLKSMHVLLRDSYLSAGNQAYLESLYEVYLTQPNMLSTEWRAIFDHFKQQVTSSTIEVSHAAIRAAFLERASHRHGQVSHTLNTEAVMRQYAKVINLIHAYRQFGHFQAQIDPLGLHQPSLHSHLDLSTHQLQEHDSLICSVPIIFFSAQSIHTIGELVLQLRRIYCGSIGFEYRHLSQENEVEWIQRRVEQNWVKWALSSEERRHILNDLIAADELEKYLGMKYVAQKRFSLEGGDALIPLLRVLTHKSAAVGVKEIVLGMAHRGRLNVLINILGKAPHAVFSEFEGKNISNIHSGDVKYHLGYSTHLQLKEIALHITLAYNPSHLEIISPVVQGSVRARQWRRGDSERQQVLPIHIHGDAALSGQGVVMETFNMAQTRWFGVGGSIHIVINNQVGFTTSDPKDARSTPYCTDIAKMVEAPILHVNANDPEAVYFAALFALEYRFAFKRDVVIDLVCYRRHGHNEADEPSATQPMMYKIIKSMPAVRSLYAAQLVQKNVITDQVEKNQAEAYRKALDEGNSLIAIHSSAEADHFRVSWRSYINQEWTAEATTAVPLETMQVLAERLGVCPKGFILQPQVQKVWNARAQMKVGQLPINWGYAEILAYATLLVEGYPIRLCGQDVGRGTFAHRHAVLHDQETGNVYIPLSHLSSKQAQINIVDSLLSEEAVLAFEYGYAATEPNHLVIWEAQFGDFANGAQVVIDQFISSSEQKWGLLCGLVMLLPHGYEGQGPEHSSARLERYLQLCAQQNMQVCVPSTPAQMFHLLRRQMIRPYRKPLIIMTPKSLLRHPLAISQWVELSEHAFFTILPEVDPLESLEMRRVIFCCGKIYYELLEKRRLLKIKDVAIVRIEQLYPFPADACCTLLSQYAHMEELIWCQEEPENQGAWTALYPHLSALLSKHQSLHYVGRPASASPAVGYHSLHMREQALVIMTALNRKPI